jgi:HicB family
MPASLHEQAKHAAASAGVRLNQFICALVAAAIRWEARPGDRPPQERRYPKSNEELGDEMWRRILEGG